MVFKWGFSFGFLVIMGFLGIYGEISFFFLGFDFEVLGIFY